MNCQTKIMSLYLAPASVASEANRLGARNGLPARQRSLDWSQRFDHEDAKDITAQCPNNWTCSLCFTQTVCVPVSRCKLKERTNAVAD